MHFSSPIASCWPFFTRASQRAAKRFLVWLTVLLGFAFSSANAQYIQRYNTITSGAITFTGNTLGLDKSATTTVNGPGTAGAIGTFITTNTALKDGTYPFGTTADWKLNSSAATLSIPTGATVLYAELIWGGSYAYGGENVKANLDEPVNFTVPGGTTSSITRDTITARTLGVSSTTANCATVPCFYVRSANVTSLVQGGGAGTYITGRVPGTQSSTENSSNVAGWTLAVVYQKSGLQARNLTLFTGSELTNTAGSSQATVNGFCTPNSSTRKGRLMVSALEGDSFGGDGMKFGPTATTMAPVKSTMTWATWTRLELSEQPITMLPQQPVCLAHVKVGTSRTSMSRAHS
jgi:large repetitive protein